MLYLFNSAFRSGYVTNVLNTLFLPHNFTNAYRYRFTGEPRYISPETYASLSKLEPDIECVIIFINRFGAQGYEYHPLRRAAYLSNHDINEQVHFRVQLGDFIYPKDFREFNRRIVQVLGPSGIPQLTSGDPENMRDGFYVIESENIFVPATEYLSGEAAWNAAVEDLSHVRAFLTNAEQAPIFARADVLDRKSRAVLPVLRDSDSLFPLKQDQPYNFRLAYRYPRQRTEQTAEVHCDIHFGDNLRPQSAAVVINLHANSVSTPFRAKRYVDDKTGSFRLTAESQAGEPKTLLPDAELPYELQDSTIFWVQLVSAFLLLVILGALLGTDFSKIRPFTWAGLVAAITWPRIGLSFMQTLLLYWLLKLVGSKVA